VLTLLVEDLLPHRAPFLWVDQILEIEPGARCVASKRLDPDEPLFTGHFSGNPIFPGVLLTEALGMAAVSAVVRVGATVVASGQLSLVLR
jgi:3-hydroxyacyl-[acyl-carrier-protein] dehydratase